MVIKEFESLISPNLSAGTNIISYNTNSLIANGENYGSVLLQVSVKVRRSDGNEEELNLVAKLCPPSEFIQMIFNTKVTFIKEIRFYDQIVPTLLKFYEERGCKNMLDIFPKYYGGRWNINNNKEIDTDACFVLENLKIKDYFICDRMKGFDLETAKCLIKQLAIFHSSAIAVKMAEPENFKNNILAHLVNHTENTVEMNDTMYNELIKVLGKYDDLEPYMDRLKANVLRGKLYDSKCDVREPFATITHNDFWTNNVMIKTDSNGKLTNCMMIDFQLVLYGNPANDLLFFIYSSINHDIIKAHYQDFIDIYHAAFIDTLKLCKVDITPFNKEAFLEEIEYSAKNKELFHILFMFSPIFTEKGTVPDHSEFSLETAITNHLDDRYYIKMHETVLDFIHKNWI